MNKRIIFALVALLFISTVNAQHGSKEERQENNGKQLKDLNLTLEQEAQWKSLKEAERKELETLPRGGTADNNKQQRRSIHEKYKLQFEALLTTGQKAVLAMSDKQHQGEKKKNRKREGKHLNLTDQQKQRIDALHTEYKSKVEELRQNNTLSQTEKKAQMRALMETHKNSLKAVLTPDQSEKIKTLRKKSNKKKLEESV